jgi:hypothetical protein
MKQKGVKAYILQCDNEEWKKEVAIKKKLLIQQSKCDHIRKTDPRHIGEGWMSQHCIDCGKDLGYLDRD